MTNCSEGRIALRDSGLSYLTDCAHVLPSAEKIDIQVDLGKVKLGNIAPYISRYIGKKEFIFQISAKGKAASGYSVFTSASGYSVFASLLMNGKLWHTWDCGVPTDQVDDYCQRLIREIVCATSCQTSEEAQLVGYWKQDELSLLEGLERLSAYLQKPADVTLLGKAVELFEKARHEPWAYQAELLSAIAVSLAQREPEEALRRMEELQDKYGHIRRRKAALQYNRAIAHFRLYEKGGGPENYDNAIGLFKSIKRPRFPLWLLWLPIPRTMKASAWVLYLLAQAGISNCYAHELNVVEERQKEKIITEIQDINERILHLVKRLRDILGPSADEVEWRIFNAEAITMLYGALDAQKGIEAAKKGLFIDTDNLPLKANLGSLILLKAKQAEQHGDMGTRASFLEEAKDIFLKLQGIGWDPEFIKYRLGRILRLRGEFDEAIKLLESVKGKDVDEKKIKAEIDKANAKNDRF